MIEAEKMPSFRVVAGQNGDGRQDGGMKFHCAIDYALCQVEVTDIGKVIK